MIFQEMGVDCIPSVGSVCYHTPKQVECGIPTTQEQCLTLNPLDHWTTGPELQPQSPAAQSFQRQGKPYLRHI